jgi:hypothetical protein
LHIKFEDKKKKNPSKYFFEFPRTDLSSRQPLHLPEPPARCQEYKQTQGERNENRGTDQGIGREHWPAGYLNFIEKKSAGNTKLHEREKKKKKKTVTCVRHAPAADLCLSWRSGTRSAVPGCDLDPAAERLEAAGQQRRQPGEPRVRPERDAVKRRGMPGRQNRVAPKGIAKIARPPV